jgi:hypothetical protein
MAGKAGAYAAQHKLPAWANKLLPDVKFARHSQATTLAEFDLEMRWGDSDGPWLYRRRRKHSWKSFAAFRIKSLLNTPTS